VFKKTPRSHKHTDARALALTLAWPAACVLQLIEAPLPKVPRDVGVSVHWLAINGQQPAVPENAPIEQPPAKRPRLDPAALHKGAAAQHAAQQQQQAAAAATAAAVAAHADGKGTAGALGGKPLTGGRSANHAAGGAAPPGGVAVQPPVRHQLSRELQVYFDRLVGLLQAAAAAEVASGALPDGGAGVGAPAPAADPAATHVHAPPAGASDAGAAPAKAGGGAAAAPAGTAAAAAAAGERHEALFRAALVSLSTDPGLHPLAPYFTAYIADAVAHGLARPPLLRRLLSLSRALLVNPAIHMEHYLNQLLPAVVTCALTSALGPRGGDEHWAVREQAAALAALAARLFGAPYHNVAPRLARLMAKAWMDPSKGFACKYGAVMGLQVRAAVWNWLGGRVRVRLACLWVCTRVFVAQESSRV
jgi:hypothetical protein